MAHLDITVSVRDRVPCRSGAFTTAGTGTSASRKSGRSQQHRCGYDTVGYTILTNVGTRTPGSRKLGASGQHCQRTRDKAGPIPSMLFCPTHGAAPSPCLQ
eukprot:1159047-Pelagomonas_calceolata.AAC.12